MAHLSAEEIDRYRRFGWAKAPALPPALIECVQPVVRALAQAGHWQELLSGIHNPFGRHACPDEAWKFLDIAESSDVLDPIEDVLGPDLVFWDSEIYFDPSALPAEESLWWPVEPLVGTLALIALQTRQLTLIDIARRQDIGPALSGLDCPFYVLRYMSAACRFQRDARFPANRRAAEARVLVNYAKRPIWLVRGVDRGENDFAAGFASSPAQWTGSGQIEQRGQAR